MKQFIDFIPLILFFVVYKISPQAVDILGHSFMVGGIFSATAMLIASSIVVYGILYVRQGKLEKSQWLTLIACLVFGSLTLAFHSETFLKWKAPVVNWLFALIFAGSHFIGDRLLIQRNHVIATMLAHLGAATREVEEPFTPEGGAYGDAHAGHDHGHGHHHH